MLYRENAALDAVKYRIKRMRKDDIDGRGSIDHSNIMGQTLLDKIRS